jgi:hypothetical protein
MEPCSQEPSIGPSPEPDQTRSEDLCDIFIFIFYGEEMLASHPIPKLENRPLSVVCDCLISILAATLHIWRPSPPSAQPEDPPCHGDEGPT